VQGDGFMNKNKSEQDDLNSSSPGEEYLSHIIHIINGACWYSSRLLMLLSPKSKKLLIDAATNFAFFDHSNEINKKGYSWLGREKGIVIDFSEDCNFHRKPGLESDCIVYVYKDIGYSDDEKERIREEKIPILEKANYSISNQHLHSTIKHIIHSDLVEFVREFYPYDRENDIESFYEEVKKAQHLLKNLKLKK